MKDIKNENKKAIIASTPFSSQRQRLGIGLLTMTTSLSGRCLPKAGSTMISTVRVVSFRSRVGFGNCEGAETSMSWAISNNAEALLSSILGFHSSDRLSCTCDNSSRTTTKIFGTKHLDLETRTLIVPFQK
jgi:hypothetical protein